MSDVGTVRRYLLAAKNSPYFEGSREAIAALERVAVERDALRAKLEKAEAHATKQRLLAEQFAEHATVLEGRLEKAKDTLKPFAKDASFFYKDEVCYPDGSAVATDVAFLRRARAVFAELSADAPEQPPQTDDEPSPPIDKIDSAAMIAKRVFREQMVLQSRGLSTVNEDAAWRAAILAALEVEPSL